MEQHTAAPERKSQRAAWRRPDSKCHLTGSEFTLFPVVSLASLNAASSPTVYTRQMERSQEEPLVLAHRAGEGTPTSLAEWRSPVFLFPLASVLCALAPSCPMAAAVEAPRAHRPSCPGDGTFLSESGLSSWRVCGPCCSVFSLSSGHLVPAWPMCGVHTG